MAHSKQEAWRWLARPKPLPGESLDSLFARAASQNGVSFDEFARNTFGTGCYGQPDRPHRRKFPRIAAMMGLTESQIEMATRYAYPYELHYDAEVDVDLAWLLPGLFHPKDRSPAVCPACIDESDQPHLKLLWRYAFVAYCPTHRTPLVDRCRHCETLLTVELDRAGVRIPGSRCCSCGLKLAPLAGLANGPWFSYQVGLLSPDVSTRWTAMAATHMQPALLGVRLILRLLLASGTNDEFRAFAEDELLLPPYLLARGGRTYQSFEYSPAADRVTVLDAVARIFEDWPRRFTTTVDLAGPYTGVYFANDPTVPLWLADAVSKYRERKRRFLKAPGGISSADSH